MLLNIYRSLRMEMNSGTVLGYFLQALPIACIVGIVFFVIRLVLLKKRKIQINWKQEILQAIFACYLTGLISLVVLPENFWLHFYDGIFYGWWEEMGRPIQFGSINLVPAIVKCLSGELSLGSWLKTMLIVNVMMFVPLGFFLPLVIKVKSIRKTAFLSVAIPFCFEAVQIFFGRSFDVDDLISNFIGMIVGCMIAYIILKAKSANAQKGR